MKGYILYSNFSFYELCAYIIIKRYFIIVQILTNVWGLKFNQKNKWLMPYIGHSTQIIHNNTVTVYPTVALNSSE